MYLEFLVEGLEFQSHRFDIHLTVVTKFKSCPHPVNDSDRREEIIRLLNRKFNLWGLWLYRLSMR